jgi:tetratricopeptide (TPR) repeat protein
MAAPAIDDWPDFNDLWDYNDPAGTERRFRALLAGKPSADPAYRLQLMTQIGRTLSLQKKYTDAHAILDVVEQQMAGGDVVEVCYLLERGRTYNSSGQPETAVPLFHRAYLIGRAIGADFYVVDALHMLAIAVLPEERLKWNYHAIDYAKGSLQERARNWLGSLYNNTGWTLFDDGRYEEALEMFEEALAFRESQGNPENVKIARWSVAKTLRLLGRVEEALAIQRELQDPAGGDGFTEEEIAECLYALGRIEEAKPYFAAAYEWLSQDEWVAADKDRLQRLHTLSV